MGRAPRAEAKDTIKQFAQVGATVGHAERSGDLRTFLAEGKKIVISTVQKFPFILDDIGTEHRGRRFAIVIDEAHSSQGGRTSAALAQALSETGAEEQDETTEDTINRLMEAKKLLPNASSFAFTATPKNKTLEIFGERSEQPDGTVQHRRAIQYFFAIRDYLVERKSPYRAVAAFSGVHEYGGAPVNEASLNGFPSHLNADRVREDPYRFLVVADKFQTGYDEPLLHTMYVDKVLSGIKAVQTLSRLNRAHPKKHDVFVLDFMNDVDTIRASFEDYYRKTILADETDPDKLHDLVSTLEAFQVFGAAQVDALVGVGRLG